VGSLRRRKETATLLVRKVGRALPPVSAEQQTLDGARQALSVLRTRQLAMDATRTAGLGTGDAAAHRSAAASGGATRQGGRRRRRGPGAGSHAAAAQAGARAGAAARRGVCAVAFPLSDRSPWPRLRTSDPPPSLAGVPGATTMHTTGKHDVRALVDAAALDPAYVVAWAQSARAALGAVADPRAC